MTQLALWPSWVSRCCGSPFTSPARRTCPCSATCSLVWLRPWDYDLTSEEFDGLFISDGPGNPETCEATIRHLHKVTKGRPSLPIVGIFLGHQLLALTTSAKTAASTGRALVSGQGVATSPRRIAASQWMPLFTNANDGSNDGSNDFSRRRLPGHGQELPVPLPYHAHMQAPAPALALAGLGWEVSPSDRRASSTTPAAKPSNAPGAARAVVPHQSQHRDGADLQGLASCARS